MSTRPARPALAGALLAACLGLSPGAHAGFTLVATMDNLRFSATDSNGNPVASAFLLDGSGNLNGYASASGATTTLTT